MANPTLISRAIVKQLPLVSTLILKPLPSRVLGGGIELVLNRLFSDAVNAGELSFLDGKVVTVEVTDISIRFSLTLHGRRLKTVEAPHSVDARLTAKLGSLLLLAAGRVDPDTLFFRRQLAITGDTELALALKNFLDSQLLEELLPAPAVRIIHQLANALETQTA